MAATAAAAARTFLCNATTGLSASHGRKTTSDAVSAAVADKTSDAAQPNAAKFLCARGSAAVAAGNARRKSFHAHGKFPARPTRH